MPSYVTPKRAIAFVGYCGLVSQANTKVLQANPTLATGDVKISIDGGAYANLTTLPTVTPAAGTSVQFSLSIAEMTGDNIVVDFIDAAGAEWCDQKIVIQTTAGQIDALADFNTAQAEPTAVPAANATVAQKLAFVAALARNKITVTATTQLLRNDGDSGTIATSTVGDSGTTFTRGKLT